MFRLEYHLSTWAEHLRQNMRMTIDETKVFKNASNLHAGDSEPIVRHFRSTQKFMHLPGFDFSVPTFMNTSRIFRNPDGFRIAELPERMNEPRFVAFVELEILQEPRFEALAACPSARI